VVRRAWFAACPRVAHVTFGWDRVTAWPLAWLRGDSVSMSAHDRNELGAIEEELAASEPKLAAMLSTFSRLAAGEAMPGRERIEAGQPPTVIQSAFGLAPRRPGPLRREASSSTRRHRLAGWVVVVWLAMSFALIAIAVALNQTGARASCTGSPVAGCGDHAPARGDHAPARPGALP
jgi:hypothetical protein